MKQQEVEALLRTQEARFREQHASASRHRLVRRAGQARRPPGVPESLREMNATGGEPDVIGHDAKTGRYTTLEPLPGAGRMHQGSCLRGFIAERGDYDRLADGLPENGH